MEPLSLEESNKVLRHQGYRLTSPRYLVLQLLEEAQEHVSIEELFEQVRQHYPSVSLSTIYRTIDLLKELYLVRGTHFPGEQVKYEAFSGEQHHHLICQNCRAVLHIENSLQEELWITLQAQYHFHQLKMDIMSVGYCDLCWQQKQEKGEETLSSARAAPFSQKEEPTEEQS